MGICLSCLGLNRHSSQDIDETDPLLDDQQAQYGGIRGGDVAQPDEEELRRERQELEHITAEATDHMIDVLHPSNTEVSQRLAHIGSQRSTARTTHPENPAVPQEADVDELEWLKSVQAATANDLTTVKGLESGNLVIDMSALREDPPASASKKALKGKLPA